MTDINRAQIVYKPEVRLYFAYFLFLLVVDIS